MTGLPLIAVILCTLCAIGSALLVWAILITAAQADRIHDKRNKKRRGS